MKNRSSSNEYEHKIGLYATPKRVRKPDSRKPEVTFKHSTNPEEIYYLYEQYYSGHNEPPDSSGNQALELYHRYYGKIADTVTLEEARINSQQSMRQHPHRLDLNRPSLDLNRPPLDLKRPPLDLNRPPPEDLEL